LEIICSFDEDVCLWVEAVE